ncbi:aminomethyl-transferring glycine dehydrogenase subunit GcvPA [Marinitoga sp. 38H-ov]|uniref:aminomethyl-transferring glycine dehydrogenase subunit GcvPA n=1 Tax=Marinitoga sp. 38H-ov TaxID=1755814 RepID=UPI0013EA067E|nr:aminomethyl-transferring glycine dehydrogenase subunit GcvPA [Marinitoga sp. 38H-ov]
MKRFPYIPHTEEDIKEMMKVIGIDDIKELYKDVPKLFEGELNIPESKSEIEVKRELKELAGRNINLEEYAMFRGAGIYKHYVPSAVYQLATKRNFITAYTPYQAEVSQGTLQALYEFQTAICELTGMEVANSSMYDGGTAVAEAILMAARVNKKNKSLIAKSIHPEYIEVSKTYTESQDLEIELINFDEKTGRLDLEDLKNKLDENTSSVVISYPNFFGVIENIKKIKEVLPENVLLIVNAYPLSLGLLEAPGKLGADIVVGEGQSLGNYMSFGGPTFGFFASKQKYIRQMPGRIIGETVDEEGKRAFVMVLQTREQHIRRAKATSNICSNHALMAVIASVYLSIIGREGLKEIAYQNYQKAHYLAKKLIETEKFEPVFESEFFNEFVIKPKFDLDKFNEKLFEEKFIGPLNLGKFCDKLENYALFCATELNTKEEIDYLISKVGEIDEITL